MEWVRAPFVQTLLWTAAILGGVWVVVPSLVFLFRLGRIDVDGDDVHEDPARAEPRGDAVYAAKVRSLLALGFRPSGITFSKARFFSPLHWSWRSRGERWLVSEDGTVFFDLYRVAGAGPWRSCAITLFEGNGFLETACSRANVKVPDGDQRRFEIEEVEPPALVAHHRALVASLSRERGLAARRSTLREISRAAGVFTSRHHPRAALALTVLVVLFAFLKPAWTALHMLGHAGGGTAPLRICAAVVAFAFIRWLFLPGWLPMYARIGAFALIPVVLPASRIAALSTLGVGRSLDRLEAVARNEGPPEAVDRSVAQFIDTYDEQSCPAVVARFEAPAIAPETRRSLHRVLVRLSGMDLGEESDAWRAWCASETYQPRGGGEALARPPKRPAD